MALQTFGSQLRERFQWGWLAGVVGVVLVALTIFFGSWFQIDQGERGVHLRNGAVVGSAEPGLGFKLPVFDTIKRISVQNLTMQYDKVPAYSKDQQTADLKVSVSYHVAGERDRRLFRVRQRRRADQPHRRRQAPTQVKNVFGQYTAVSAVQNRGNFMRTDARRSRRRPRARW